MLRIMMSPADRWNVERANGSLRKLFKTVITAEIRCCRALRKVHRQAQCQNVFHLEGLYYIMEEKSPSLVQGRIKTARTEKKKKKTFLVIVGEDVLFVARE